MLLLVAFLSRRMDMLSLANWRQVLGNLLMLQDLGALKPNVVVEPLFATALWSLHYEWWFYMLYYPIRRHVPDRMQLHVVGLMGICSTVVYLSNPQWWFRFFVYFPIWWTGVVLAKSYKESGAVRSACARTPLLYLGAIASLLIVGNVNTKMHGGNFAPGVHPFLELRHVGAAVVAVVAALVWQKWGWVGFKWLAGWGCWIAPISYSLYIAHQPLLANASYLAGVIGPQWLVGVGYCAVLVLFCWFSELWFYPLVRRIAK